MKNMNYEKKYNEALNWMRELYPGLHGATKEDAERYFPELKESKESKDERIRKAIVELVKRTPSSMFDADTVGKWIGASHDEILAYLEKQKEPTNEELYAEAGTTEKEYIANTMRMVRAMREKQKEQQ